MTILRLICGIAGVVLLGLSIIWWAWQDRQDYYQRLDKIVPVNTSPDIRQATKGQSSTLED